MLQLTRRRNNHRICRNCGYAWEIALPIWLLKESNTLMMYGKAEQFPIKNSYNDPNFPTKDSSVYEFHSCYLFIHSQISDSLLYMGVGILLQVFLSLCPCRVVYLSGNNVKLSISFLLCITQKAQHGERQTA